MLLCIIVVKPIEAKTFIELNYEKIDFINRKQIYCYAHAHG